MTTTAPPSKNELKRRLKRERVAEHKRLHREMKTALAPEDNDANSSSPAVVDRKVELVDDVPPYFREEFSKCGKERAASLRLSFTRVLNSRSRRRGVKVILDASFDHLMNERERKSLASQLSYCYNANRTAFCPLDLSVCGLKSGTLTAELMQTNYHAASWTPYLCVEPPQEENDHFLSSLTPEERAHVVYLTADSDVTLVSLERDTTYVLGAFVDRNRHKGVTAGLAARLGIRTARFPLEEHFSKHNFSRVLTTNHALEVLLELEASRGRWAQACRRGVPLRKSSLPTEKSEQDGDDDEPPLQLQAESTSGKPPHHQRTAVFIGTGTSFPEIAHSLARNLMQRGWQIICECAMGDEENAWRVEDTSSGDFLIFPGDALNEAGDALRLNEAIRKRLRDPPPEASREFSALVMVCGGESDGDLERRKLAVRFRDLQGAWLAVAKREDPLPRVLVLSRNEHDREGAARFVEGINAALARFPSAKAARLEAEHWDGRDGDLERRIGYLESDERTSTSSTTREGEGNSDACEP